MAFVLQGSCARCDIGGGSHGHSHGFGSHSHSHSAGHSHGQNNNVDGVADERDEDSPSMRRRTVSITAYPTEELSHVKKQGNINVRAAFIHVLGDLFQSIGVLVAAIIVKLRVGRKSN